MKELSIEEILLNRLVGLEQWHDYAHHLYCGEHKIRAQEFRDYRLASGASLRSVAKQMEVSAQFLSDLERGNRLWHEPTAKQYFEAIKVLTVNRKA